MPLDNDGRDSVAHCKIEIATSLFASIAKFSALESGSSSVQSMTIARIWRGSRLMSCCEGQELMRRQTRLVHGPPWTIGRIVALFLIVLERLAATNFVPR